MSAFDAASLISRDLGRWFPAGLSADAAILPELDTLIARERDLEYNHGVAAGAPQRINDHVIGTKLKFNSTPDYKALGRTREWADEFAETVERLWEQFSNSLFFDYQEQSNFTAFAGLVMRGRFSNGGHGVLPMWVPNRAGSKYATCFMGVEIDRISNPQGRQDDSKIRGGIEYSKRGVPIAVWIRNNHPGDLYINDQVDEWVRVPMRTSWGRLRFLHCFKKDRSGQSRGTPALASVLKEFKSLSRYHAAELKAAVHQAMITYFIETQLGSEGIAALFGNTQQFIDSRADYNNLVKSVVTGATMEDNIIVPVYPGDKVHNPQMNRPNSEFEHFCDGVLKYIAASLPLSKETLLGDFQKINYSGARMALNADWRTFLGMREWLSMVYCRPIIGLFFELYCSGATHCNVPTPIGSLFSSIKTEHPKSTNIKLNLFSICLLFFD